MRASSVAAAMVLGLALSLSAVPAEADDQAARRYELLMQKASALRQEADRIRSEGEAAGKLDSARGRAKALDAEADALVEKARTAEPSGWPPQ